MYALPDTPSLTAAHHRHVTPPQPDPLDRGTFRAANKPVHRFSPLPGDPTTDEKRKIVCLMHQTTALLTLKFLATFQLQHCTPSAYVTQQFTGLSHAGGLEKGEKLQRGERISPSN